MGKQKKKRRRETFAAVLEEIQVPVWVVRGAMMIRRDALEPDDPDHTYNFVKRMYNVDPADFGIPKPPQPTVCPHCGGKFWPKLE